MILVFTKRSLQPGVTALTIQGSIHCGPECARLEQEVDALHRRPRNARDF